jgi:LacI family transcriptional regulator
MDRGYRNYAFYGRHTAHGRRRWKIIDRLIRERRGNCASVGNRSPLNTSQLTHWVRGLARPTAIICADDAQGRQILDALRIAKIAVPEEITVLGFDNDALMCDIAHPRLSSVALNAQRIGFEAAAMLDAIMHGRPVLERVEIPPVGVVTRRSTDAIGCDDAVVAEVAHYIHEKAITGIGVADAVQFACTSRRSLETRFRGSLGKSIHAAIQGERLQRAKDMLIHTNFKLAYIAQKSGFSNAEYMHRVFRRELKMTPISFRTLHGHHPASTQKSS